MQLADALIEKLLRFLAVGLDGEGDIAGFTIHPACGLARALVERFTMAGVSRRRRGWIGGCLINRLGQLRRQRRRVVGCGRAGATEQDRGKDQQRQDFLNLNFICYIDP